MTTDNDSERDMMEVDDIKQPVDGALKATHEGDLIIGELRLPTAVLENGVRVLTSSSLLTALGRPWKGSYKRTNMPNFIEANNLKPYITKDLEDVLTPVQYTNLRGMAVTGYKAELLPIVCDLYLAARADGKLSNSQQKIAQQSEILVRSLSKVGIIALVDEATGYQFARARDALEKIFEQFIAKELQKWTKTFPDEFYEQMFRLNNWKYSAITSNRPGIVGNFTNDIVYERLAPGVLEELKRLTPKDSRGRNKHKYHQRLTPDSGHPRLKEHLTAVIALMRASGSWKGFKSLLDRAYPKYGSTMELALPDAPTLKLDAVK